MGLGGVRAIWGLTPENNESFCDLEAVQFGLGKQISRFALMDHSGTFSAVMGLLRPENNSSAPHHLKLNNS